jgi:hypothetical protein
MGVTFRRPGWTETIFGFMAGGGPEAWGRDVETIPSGPLPVEVGEAQAAAMIAARSSRGRVRFVMGLGRPGVPLRFPPRGECRRGCFIDPTRRPILGSWKP